MSKLKIHFFNTVWSDAVLIEENNHYAFIDVGSKYYYEDIKDYLDKLGVEHIDFIILTHFHHDHYGNIVNLVNDYQIDKIYLKEYYNVEGSTSTGTMSSEEYLKQEQDNYLEILNACSDKLIFLDKLHIPFYTIYFEDTLIELYDLESHLNNLYEKVDSPTYHKHLFNENFNCMGIYLKHDDKNLYFGGDVPDSNNEIEELSLIGTKILKQIKERHHIDKFDLCKAPHHGTPYFCTDRVASLLQADHIIITNSHRWIDDYKTIELFLKVKNSNILLTENHKYIFSIDKDISYEEIEGPSAFFKLGE